MKMAVRAGEMNRLIELQEDIGGEPDEDGRTQPNWVTRAKANAKIEQLTGGEQVVFDQARPTATYRLTMWYLPSVKLTADWRVKYGDRYLYLVGPPNNVNEQNRQWELTCTETPLSNR